MKKYDFSFNLRNNFFVLNFVNFIKKNFFEFSIFSFYGLFSNIFSFILFFSLTKYLLIDYQTSYLTVTSFIITLNFFVYKIIFKSFINLQSLIKYLIVQVFVCSLHLLLITISVESLELDIYFSHIFSNILLSISIYFLYKFFVYKK